ncbi:hypothetical protein [Leifsonia xyli]|nr:hypothetical protein [Leifsonia xyli]
MSSTGPSKLANGVLSEARTPPTDIPREKMTVAVATATLIVEDAGARP